MKEIFDHELPQYGIRTNHNIMDNGERRFRLSGADGSCYIRTEAPADSGWQNSHYHTRLSEICVVRRADRRQSGCQQIHRGRDLSDPPPDPPQLLDGSQLHPPYRQIR